MLLHLLAGGWSRRVISYFFLPISEYYRFLKFCFLYCCTIIFFVLLKLSPNLVKEGPLTSISMSFDMNLLVFEYFLAYDVLGSPCILPQSWISRFSKEPWYDLVDNGIQKLTSGTKYTHCYWDIIASGNF